MIVTRTPLRVSFLGGGSDYLSHFSRNPGYVLGTTINQYVYVSVLELPKFAEEKYRFTYRITESVQKIEDFKHPVVRSSLLEKKWSPSINLATMADLPGRSGLGSSSSFTVGLELALSTYEKSILSAEKLAQKAIFIERELLKESGGFQDQYHAAIGGFRLYEFTASKISADLINLGDDFLRNTMVLIPMSDWRDSHDFASATNIAIGTSTGSRLVSELAELAKQTFEEINREDSPLKKLQILASATRVGWDKKVALSDGSIAPNVTSVISDGLSKGALAGRLCGAGGTGFILFLVLPSFRAEFIESFSDLNAFGIESVPNGSEVLLDSR